MKRVLIVEDEEDIRDFIVINLKRAGFEVVEAESGEEALAIIQNEKNLDIMLLDIMLPGIDGYKVLKKTRENNSLMGIIMLTAKSQEIDKVTGLTYGADDYIVKPFSPMELIARIDAILRRINNENNIENKKILTSGIFKLDLEAKMFFKEDKEIELTQTEFLLIELFLKNEGKVLSRNEILDSVWGSDHFGDIKIVDVNMRRVRQKVENDSSSPKYINTVRGFGYKWGKDK
ncbi:response regulator transcription factor [Clostridium thailandense]|uniref:response regulator transcription factor n=1 Tax=Clostridium thailandense TaxID=2794346 RepID=UPI003988C268